MESGAGNTRPLKEASLVSSSWFLPQNVINSAKSPSGQLPARGIAFISRQLWAAYTRQGNDSAPD